MTTTLSGRRPPQVPGLPFIGNGLALAKNPIEFMVQAYHSHGPVYRIKVPGRPITIMAGLNANTFMMQNAGEYFRLQPIYGKLVEETNSELYLPTLDEPAYSYYRKMIRPRLSRETLAGYMPNAVRYIQDTVQHWMPGEMINVMDTMTRLCLEIISRAAEHTEVGDLLPAIILFTNRLIGSGVAFQPAYLLKRPDYLAAKARFEEFLQGIVNRHRESDQSDYVDLLLKARTFDGKPLTGHDLLAYVHLPYVNGIAYAPRLCSYMLYELLRHPDLQAKVLAEIDKAFAIGPLDLAALRNMRWLYGTCMETLRMYPVAGALPRSVAKTFEFEGYTIPQGQLVFIATGVSHFLPTLYHEPYRFDPERYFEPRKEHHRPGAFAPYGLGSRTCLSAGLGESLMMTVMATLLHSVRLELLTPNFKLKTRIDPIPGPDRRFKVRVVEHRTS